MAHFQMPEFKLEFVTRTEPIRGPGLHALPFATNPMAHQIARVSKSRNPSRVVIKKTRPHVAANRWIRIDTFGAKIHFRKFRQFGNVDSAQPRCNIRTNDRTDRVVLGHPICVKRQAAPNAITEIQTGPPGTGFVRSTWYRRVGRENTSRERVEGQGIIWATIICGS